MPLVSMPPLPSQKKSLSVSSGGFYPKILHGHCDLPAKIQNLLSRFQTALDLPDPAEAGPVAVAMSGGVDSSVAAATLAFLGYNVIGITLRLYTAQKTARSGSCCAGRDIKDAASVAKRMNFPHYVLDYEKQFRDAVITPFAQSYARGETPIPCTLCNEHIKFQDLLDKSKSLECAALVTGHYAQRFRRPSPLTHHSDHAKNDTVHAGSPVRRRTKNSQQEQPCTDVTDLHALGTVHLARAIDATRDQSYFLYGTPAEALAYVRFPLGGLMKSETRILARFLHLDLAEKPESQDICFVGDHYTDTLARLVPESLTPGPILNNAGQKIGMHQGVGHYTIGQRKRLGIGGSQHPLFVTDIDTKNSTITIGPKENLGRQKFTLRNLKLLQAKKDFLGKAFQVRLRSSGNFLNARIILDSLQKTALVILDKPEEGIAPGQSCVFYQESFVLGGGIIHDVFKK